MDLTRRPFPQPTINVRKLRALGVTAPEPKPHHFQVFRTSGRSDAHAITVRARKGKLTAALKLTRSACNDWAAPCVTTYRAKVKPGPRYNGTWTITARYPGNPNRDFDSRTITTKVHISK